MFDLHVHTKASDGEYSPTEIVEKAYNCGLDTIAITDHDTIDGIEEAIAASKKYNIEVISGIELNAHVDHGKMHILGYFKNYQNSDFLHKMNDLKQDRQNRNLKFIKEFNNQGIDITIDDIKKYSFGEILAKPHFARALYEKKYINDIEEAYKNFFNVEPMKSIKRETISPREAIELIKKVNGIVILAHPITLKLNYEDLNTKIQELMSYGLDGIECYNSIHTQEDITALLNIAKQNNLLVTAGSDYHGPISTPFNELGKGRNNNLYDAQNNSFILKNLKGRLS